jgi:hypothetical protein
VNSKGIDNAAHTIFGHEEWKISVDWKNFSIEELQNLLFFILEVNDKIKDDEMVETNMCAGSGEEDEIKTHHLKSKF